MSDGESEFEANERLVKYEYVQEKLHALSYNKPFGQESCDLVEQLLDDLIHLTAHCRELKESNQEAALELQVRTAERDAIGQRLEEFEREFIEIQNEVKLIVEENDELKERLATSALPSVDGPPTAPAAAAPVGAVSEAAQQQSELRRLRAVLEATEQQRAQLQAEADALTERLAALPGDVDRRERRLVELDGQLQHAAADIASLSQQLADKDREIHSLKRQTERLTHERNHFEADSKVNSQTVLSLNEELARFTKEQRTASREAASVVAERDRLRAEVQEAATRAVHLDQLVHTAERERQELAEAMRRQGQEAARLEAQLHAARLELDSARQQLQAQAAAAAHMEALIDEIEQENNRYVTELRGFERHTENLSRTIVKMEEQIETVQKEKADLASDLEASGKVSQTLEQALHDVRRDIAGLSEDYEHLAKILDETKTDRDQAISRFQLQTERVKELERLLRQERQRAFDSLSTHPAAAAAVTAAPSAAAPASVRSKSPQSAPGSMPGSANGSPVAAMSPLALTSPPAAASASSSASSMPAPAPAVSSPVAAAAGAGVSSARSTPLSAAAAAASRSATASSRASPAAQQLHASRASTDHGEDSDLQKTIATQAEVIKSMEEERLRLKNYVMKYELQLKQHEQHEQAYMERVQDLEEKIASLAGESWNDYLRSQHELETGV